LSQSRKDSFFQHYIHDDVHHRRRWWNVCIRLDVFEKVLEAFKDIDQSLFYCTDAFNRLTNVNVELDRKETKKRRI
jgi:hypothetical protein